MELMTNDYIEIFLIDMLIHIYQYIWNALKRRYLVFERPWLTKILSIIRHHNTSFQVPESFCKFKYGRLYECCQLRNNRFRLNHWKLKFYTLKQSALNNFESIRKMEKFGIKILRNLYIKTCIISHWSFINWIIWN